MATWSVAFANRKGLRFQFATRVHGGKTGWIRNGFEENVKAVLTNLLMLFMTVRHSGFQKLHWGTKGDQSRRISGTFLKTTHYLTAAKKWRGIFPHHHVHLCGTIVHNGGHVRAQYEPEQWHLLKSGSCPPSSIGHITPGCIFLLSQTQQSGTQIFPASPEMIKLQKALKKQICVFMVSVCVLCLSTFFFLHFC